MATEMNVELLPCPFCGGLATEIMGLVGCEKCALVRRDAETWNRRAAQPADVGAMPSPQAAQGVLVAELVRAADAVVERWHSRDWKQPHTHDFIYRLDGAVGALKRAAPPLSSEQQAKKGESNVE
jgi:hypothetical protein